MRRRSVTRSTRAKRTVTAMTANVASVVTLGGHLEVRAVFPEETVTLLREPAPG